MNTSTNEALLARVVRRRMRLEPPSQVQPLLHAWLERSPQSPAAHALAGLIEAISGQQESGLRKVQHAASAANACALWAMAQLHVLDEASTDAAAARSCLERAVSIDPNDADCWLMLARLNATEGRWGAAAHAAARACELDPHAALSHLIVAELALQRNDLAAARVACSAALAREPQWAGAYELDAQVLAQSGDLTLACERLEMALLLQPPTAATLNQLASWRLLAGDPAQLQLALSHARQAYTLAPEDWRGPLIESQILHAQSRHAEAAARLASAVRAHPKSSELWLSLVVSAMVLGKTDMVDSALEHARTLAPDAPAVATMKVAVDLRLGRWSSAFTSMQGGHVRPAAGQSIRLQPASLLELLTLSRWCAQMSALDVRVELMTTPQDAGFAQRIPGVAVVDSSTAAGTALTALPGMLAIDSPQQGPTTPWLNTSPAAEQAWRRHLVSLPHPWLFVDLGPKPDPRLVESLGAELARREGTLLLNHSVPAWEGAGHAVQIQRVQVETLEDASACLAVADEHWLIDGDLAALAAGLGLPARVHVGLMHHPFWAGVEQSCPWYPSLRIVREDLEGWRSSNAVAASR